MPLYLTFYAFSTYSRQATKPADIRPITYYPPSSRSVMEEIASKCRHAIEFQIIAGLPGKRPNPYFHISPGIESFPRE